MPSDTATHPNPAEVFKSRGWQVGDKVKTATGGIQEITFVGRDYIHTLGCLGSPFTWERHEIVTHWTKVEPKPRYTVGGHCIYRDRTLLGWICRAAGITDEGYAEAVRVASIGVAALNGEQTPGTREAKEEGPHYVVHDVGVPSDFDVYRGEHDLFATVTYYDRTPDISNREMAEIARRCASTFAAELNALHAKGKGKAEALRSPTDG